MFWASFPVRRIRGGITELSFKLKSSQRRKSLLKCERNCTFLDPDLPVFVVGIRWEEVELRKISLLRDLQLSFPKIVVPFAQLPNVTPDPSPRFNLLEDFLLPRPGMTFPILSRSYLVWIPFLQTYCALVFSFKGFFSKWSRWWSRVTPGFQCGLGIETLMSQSQPSRS